MNWFSPIRLICPMIPLSFLFRGFYVAFQSTVLESLSNHGIIIQYQVRTFYTNICRLQKLILKTFFIVSLGAHIFIHTSYFLRNCDVQNVNKHIISISITVTVNNIIILKHLKQMVNYYLSAISV